LGQSSGQRSCNKGQALEKKVKAKFLILNHCLAMFGPQNDKQLCNKTLDQAVEVINQFSKKESEMNLVGGFNPFEKY